MDKDKNRYKDNHNKRQRIKDKAKGIDKLRDLLKDNEKGFKSNRQRQALGMSQARQLMKDRNKNKDKT